jgi:hypothetical protein
MRFNEFSKFIIKPHLFENKQQYKQIMDTVVSADLIDQSTANSVLGQAKQLLKRADRIIWWLRWWRISTVHEVIARKISQEERTAVAPVSDAEKRESEEKINEYKQLFKKLTKKDFDSIEKYSLRTFLNWLDLVEISNHWAAMFEQSPQVNQVEWEANLTPTELIRRLQEAEEEWEQKQEQELEPEPDDQIIIDYGKYAWVKLDREYCDAEGKAMGHCGNTGSPQKGDRILSFRSKVGETKQKPHLTFILDKDGYLGEMKGRGNDKPSEKYHPYIIDLLQKDFVKGIKGGGYLPQNNFSLSDLDDEQRKALIEQKPQLGTSYDILKADGSPSERFYEKLEAELDAYDVFYFDINTKTHQIILDGEESSAADLDIINKNVETNVIDTASKLMTGDMIGPEIYDYPRDYIKMIMDNVADDLYQSLDSNYKSQIEKFVKENYSDDVDWDEDSLEEIVSNVDELKSAFMSATLTGRELGDEAEMISDFKGWMDRNEVQYNRDNQKFYFTLSSSEISEFIHDAIEAGAEDDVGDYIGEQIDIDRFDEPYGGWDGFDTDAAKERLREELADEDIVEIR